MVSYLWLKALHIIFMTSWFAGLFYLPRIYVNLAMSEHQQTYAHLLMMARKLFFFVTPFALLTLVFGVWMILLNPGVMQGLWMHIKLTLVLTLYIYHAICYVFLRQFSDHRCSKSHVFFRWFNEYPVLVLFAAVILVVVKPGF